MDLRQTIEAAAKAHLPTFVRAPQWERKDRLCLEDPGARRILLFQIGVPAKHIQLLIFEYGARPAPVPTVFDDLGAPRPDLSIAWIGPLPLATAEDRDRVHRLLAHVAAHGDLIDFGDPFLRAFLDALPSDPRDLERGRAFVRDALWSAVSGLRDDVAGSSLTLPVGTLRLAREQGYPSERGLVPDFVRLALDDQPTASASAWFQANTVSFVPGLYVSPAERARLFEEYFAEGRRELERTGRWDVVAPGTTAAGEPRAALALVLRGGRLEPEPSKAFVQWINRGARTRPFADFIAPLDEASWRSIHDKSATPGDPVALLEAAIAREPRSFAHYKALADHHTRAGDPARANLALGLGYLRAHRVLGVARGKLDLAAAADPSCPGLAEARRELEEAVKGSEPKT